MPEEPAASLAAAALPAATLPNSEGLHAKSSLLQGDQGDQLLRLFEEESLTVSSSLVASRESILQLGSAYASTLRAGGRIIYMGAGTSGRLGLLDAAEWPPTFGIEPDRVLCLLAGGPQALGQAVEGAEDDAPAAITDLDRLGFCKDDLCVGISASGGAAYVRAGIEYALQKKAMAAMLTANDRLQLPAAVLRVLFATGAELLAGSTRLKAATATHQLLQRASTLCALEMGWIYAGYMVEMRPTNLKLRDRAERIIVDLTTADRNLARETLLSCQDDIKLALVMLKAGVGQELAAKKLQAVDRHLSRLPEFAL